MREVYGLERIKEGKEGDDAFVGTLFLGRELAVKHPCVILEAGNLLWDPEVSHHDLVERFRPGVFDRVQVEEAGRGTFDDGAVFDRIVPFGIEEAVSFDFERHRISGGLVQV